MNRLDMELTGSNATGWRWAVSIDGVDVERTPPLAPEDLAEGLASIQRDEDRCNPEFDAIDDEHLGFLLGGFFAGAFAQALRSSAEEQVWAKHLVTPSLPTELSGAFMFLVSSSASGFDRLLLVDGGKTRSLRVPAGRFDALLREVRTRLEASA